MFRPTTYSPLNTTALSVRSSQDIADVIVYSSFGFSAKISFKRYLTHFSVLHVIVATVENEWMIVNGDNKAIRLFFVVFYRFSSTPTIYHYNSVLRIFSNKKHLSFDRYLDCCTLQPSPNHEVASDKTLVKLGIRFTAARFVSSSK